MEMKKDDAKLGRRDFLRAMGAGAGLAATAVAATSLAATEAVAAESEKEKKKARYNPNSEDVKNYYRVNRF
jgi:sugar (pentulose or hexulose) kinase